MISRRLITVFLLLAAVCGYLYFGEAYRQWLLPGSIFLGLAILTYVMQHQINWLWYRRFPPPLPSAIDSLYRRVSPIYANMPEEARRAFGTRAALFVIVKDFIGQGIDKIPEDIKYMVAYYAVLLTMHQKDFLFEGYDRVVFYLHPFLSPNFPEDVHICEVEHVDGTIILSIEHLTASFFSPSKYYASGLHAMAEAYQAKYGTDHEEWPEDIWGILEEVSGQSKDDLEEYIGLRLLDPWPVIVHHWYSHRAGFQQVAPEVARKVESEFG